MSTPTASPHVATPLPFEEAVALAQRLDAEIGRVIIGQRGVRREILTALFAGGHVLLRGVPGLAKTLLIRTLADAVQLAFKREADPQGLLNPGKMIAWENPDYDYRSDKTFLFRGLQRVS